MKHLKFNQLGAASQENAVRLYNKYNNPKKKSIEEVKRILSNKCFTFLRSGELYNGLTN